MITGGRGGCSAKEKKIEGHVATPLIYCSAGTELNSKYRKTQMIFDLKARSPSEYGARASLGEIQGTARSVVRFTARGGGENERKGAEEQNEIKE